MPLTRRNWAATRPSPHSGGVGRKPNSAKEFATVYCTGTGNTLSRVCPGSPRCLFTGNTYTDSPYVPAAAQVCFSFHAAGPHSSRANAAADALVRSHARSYLQQPRSQVARAPHRYSICLCICWRCRGRSYPSRSPPWQAPASITTSITITASIPLLSSRRCAWLHTTAF